MTTRTRGIQARLLVYGLAVTLLPGAALTAADSVDASTLNGKVLLGYQGWFNCPGDGSPRESWRSWSRSVPAADTLTIDLYPDLSELTPAERCLVPGMTIGGKPAYLYSAWRRPTVLRHFQWMKDYGLDGVLVQRFVGSIREKRASGDVVLKNVIAGAEAYGRTFAVEYDITGGDPATFAETLKEDWKYLVDELKITSSPRYQRHNGKPVVSVWGMGLDEPRHPPDRAAAAKELIEWFQSKAPEKYRVTYMGGTPSRWRTLEGDSHKEAEWAGVFKQMDVIQPWTVGRYRSLETADQWKEERVSPDLARTVENHQLYMPVIFPGFSWHNLRAASPANQIPRNRGEFLWRQAYNARMAGATLLKIAMFDEVNEGTAIFKAAPKRADAPDQGFWLTLDADGADLPSDWYLRLAGEITRMFHGEIKPTPELPSNPMPAPGRRAVSTRNYHFDGSISREVLENYLSRSITMTEIYRSPGNLDDDIRMLKNIGAKFAGRTIYLWGDEKRINDPAFLAQGREMAARIHRNDPDVALQAAVFEIVTEGVSQIPVPDWVFKEFGQTPETRNFDYSKMLFPDVTMVDHWRKGSSVPDIRQVETKMWFFFLAASYMDIGIEAIHFGQLDLVGRKDTGYANWMDLLQHVRAYAAKKARRHYVICDAHVPKGGPVVDGKLLLDFHSFPLRPKEVADSPGKAVLVVGYSDGIYGRSNGGIAPSGWKCEHLPYLVEFDNFGGTRTPGQASQAQRPSIFTWGYDEITWFAQQPEAYRNEWLHYAWNWLKETDKDGFLEMPGGRMLTNGPIIGDQGKARWYFANTRSPANPQGFDQEETIKAIWLADAGR